MTEEASIKIITSSKLLWDQLIYTHLDHIAEANFKVSSSALSSLYVITDTFPEKISLALEKILPRLLISLSDPKETVSSVAMKVLELIIDIYIPEDLLALLLKYNSSELKPTTYLKFLEVLSMLAYSSTEFFLLNSNIKNYLNKLLFLFKEMPKGCGKDVLAAVEISFDKNRNSSISILNDFSPYDLSIFRQLFKDFNSKLEPIFREPVKETIRDSFKEPVLKETIKESSFREPIKESTREISSKSMNFVSEIKKNSREEVKTTFPSSKQEALKKLQKLNEEGDDFMWEKNFKDFLNICVECQNEPSLAEATIKTLQSIFIKRRGLCQSYVYECIFAVAKGFYTESRNIMQITEEIIEELVCSMNCTVIIPVLIQNIREQEVPAIQGFIRILTKVVTLAKPSNLMSIMRTIMNQMKDSLNHGNADVRKSVVFCLVEIQAVIKEDFNQYLEELTPSQQKLVGIYIQRRLAL